MYFPKVDKLVALPFLYLDFLHLHHNSPISHIEAVHYETDIPGEHILLGMGNEIWNETRSEEMQKMITKATASEGGGQVIETGVKTDPMYGEVNLDNEERYYEEQVGVLNNFSHQKRLAIGIVSSNSHRVNGFDPDQANHICMGGEKMYKAAATEIGVNMDKIVHVFAAVKFEDVAISMTHYSEIINYD